MKSPRQSAGLDHNQPGNPSKHADVLVAFADAPNPLVRLPLGSDTVAVIDAKHKSDSFILSEMAQRLASIDF
jgi:hypothetical protein